MKIFLFFIISIMMVSGCRPKPTALSSYDQFIKSWKDSSGASIHRLVSKKWHLASDANYWKYASKDPSRKIVELPKKSKPEWTATVDSPTGKVNLKVVNGKWKLVSLPFPNYSRQTPEEAVNSFILALEFSRLEILASLLTEEFRLSLTREELTKLFDLQRPEIQELLGLLKKARGTPVIIREGSAVFPYTSTKSLKLIKQEEGWCIADPD
jgi:hypothetical protein